MIGELLTPLQFGMPGGMELAVILLIAVLLFGANKIPKLARATGQAMGEFQRGREEIEQELQEIEEGGDDKPDATDTTDADQGSTEESTATESTDVDTAETDSTDDTTEDETV